MRIGFNLLPYKPGEHGGAEFYFRNIIQCAMDLADDEQFYLFGATETLEAYAIPRPNCHVVPVGSARLPRPVRIAAEQFVLPGICRRHRIDCLVSNYVCPVRARCNNVVIVHDMLAFRYPEVFELAKLAYWRMMIPRSIRASSAVVAVSNFSAEEIRYFVPTAKGKTFVTVEGIRPSLQREHVTSEFLPKLPEQFFLCVGSFGQHKNLHIAVDALAELPSRHSDVCLVVVGAARTPDARKYQTELKNHVVDKGLESRVKFVGYVSDAQMTGLLSTAQAFLLPSLYEGFGLPIIEAQHWGCPVVCSNCAVMPETAGDGALFFDPLVAESLRDAMVQLLCGGESVAELRKKGFENAAQYSWPRAAKELLNAIHFACGVRAGDNSRLVLQQA